MQNKIERADSVRISLNAGHTLKGEKGAGAYYKGMYEGDITRAVAKELTKLLRAKGHKVYSSTIDKATSQNSYLKQVCNLTNNLNVDLFISLHTNASASHNGKGCEVFTWKGKKHKEAANICANMQELGLNNRGVKDGSNLYVIKHTKPKALLVELFFIDNEIDRTIYNTAGAKKIAEAICKSL